MQTNYVSYVFFTLNSSMLLELLYHPQCLCDRIFWNAILENKFFLSRSQYILNMAEHFIIVETQCGHKALIITKTVGMWIQLQTARLCKFK